MKRAFTAILTMAMIGIASATVQAIEDRETPVLLWIDTDAACGSGPTTDVDDCWAVLGALRDPSSRVVGISTVAGNAEVSTVTSIVRNLVQLHSADLHTSQSGPGVYEGLSQSYSGGDVSPEAVVALTSALERRPLTILALGPLTNIAKVLDARPDLVDSVEQLIAVAGSRRGERRFFPGTRTVVHFHDFNLYKDPSAFRTVLRSGVPVTLAPYEAASQIVFRESDLSTLSNTGSVDWLLEQSREWIDFWNVRFGADGFFPFDSVAVGFAHRPDLFETVHMYATVEDRVLFAPRARLLVGPENGTAVTYIVAPRDGAKEFLIDQLSEDGE